MSPADDIVGNIIPHFRGVVLLQVSWAWNIKIFHPKMP
jgi:hypothetical protein